MAVKKTGIFRDLIIHPGETIADVLDDRGITQLELASRTGGSPSYVNNVIAGKKGISTNFARGLEYALGVPKSFWLNLQANYEAELLMQMKNTLSYPRTKDGGSDAKGGDYMSVWQAIAIFAGCFISGLITGRLDRWRKNKKRMD